MIGRDFYASVGRGTERSGVCGKHRLSRSNEAGKDIIKGCEEHGLALPNGNMKHARRGTWRKPERGKWYELDGFVVREKERHRMVRRM